ncbi:hypothetical protein C8Q79DRAFT_419685 [Trametes meyenii]|nr:hypothetical protein C8Q79DRAFT_419685 [Trametes meyenii]
MNQLDMSLLTLFLRPPLSRLAHPPIVSAGDSHQSACNSLRASNVCNSYIRDSRADIPSSVRTLGTLIGYVKRRLLLAIVDGRGHVLFCSSLSSAARSSSNHSGSVEFQAHSSS